MLVMVHAAEGVATAVAEFSDCGPNNMLFLGK